MYEHTNTYEHEHIPRWKSGETISAGSLANPVCIVATYLFDTLYHDIFQVEGGQLKEGLVSVGSKGKAGGEEPDPLDPDIITRLDNRYSKLYRRS